MGSRFYPRWSPPRRMNTVSLKAVMKNAKRKGSESDSFRRAKIEFVEGMHGIDATLSGLKKLLTHLPRAIGPVTNPDAGGIFCPLTGLKWGGECGKFPM